MSGVEDQEIHQFFRESAFPSEDCVSEILDLLARCDGLSIRAIEEQTNLRHGQIEKVLKLLSVENLAPVIKVGSQWRRTPVPYTMDHGIGHLTGQRVQEWAEVQAYLTDAGCKMSYLRRALDDANPAPCGKCTSCLGHPIVNVGVDAQLAHVSGRFLKQAEMVIIPRKQVAPSNDETARAFPTYQFPRLLKALAAQEGRVLSRWGDAGWGRSVLNGKHSNHFGDELVEATAEMIQQRWQPDPEPAWVCCVPSLNHPELVPNFTMRLAQRLGLPFVGCVEKASHNQSQKEQQNSFHQCQNLDGAFTINQPVPSGPVLLVDDIVDSRWTLAVMAALLQQAGSGVVFPVTLASTSVSDS